MQQEHAPSGTSLISVVDAARRLNVSERWLRGQIALGLVPVVRLGRRVLIDEGDLARFVEAHRDGGEAA